MTGLGIDSCTVAQHQISLEIDRRLSTSDARELAQHLRECGGCRAFRDEIHVLRERVGDLPLPHGPVDLAQRARRAAAKRRAGMRSTAGGRWQRAASILIGALSLLNAYGIGRHRLTTDVDGLAGVALDRERPNLALAPVLPELGGSIAPVSHQREPGRDREELTSPRERRSEPAPALVVEDAANRQPVVPSDALNRAPAVAIAPAPASDPANAAEPQPSTAPDPYISRASRALLSDLAVLDEIPQNQRVPLIQAQMKRFGLTDWVASESSKQRAVTAPNDLAVVLQRVLSALDSADPEEALHRLRVDPDVGLVFAALRGVGPIHDDAKIARPDRKLVVADVASQLGAAERAKLEELLHFKESWIEGSYGPAVRVATGAADDDPRMDHEPFGPSLRVAVVSALAEAGGRKDKGKRSPRDESIRVPFKPIEFMHLENARFDVGNDGNGLTIRVDYGSGDH